MAVYKPPLFSQFPRSTDNYKKEWQTNDKTHKPAHVWCDSTIAYNNMKYKIIHKCPLYPFDILYAHPMVTKHISIECILYIVAF